MALNVLCPVNAELAPHILELFANEWWTRDRTAADVTAILAGSTATVGLVDGDSLVGFARVLSDRCYLGLILDVIVEPSRRGDGLGDQLMATVLALECLRSVSSIELVCQPDKVAFYERHGFTSNIGGSSLMRRTLDTRLTA